MGIDSQVIIVGFSSHNSVTLLIQAVQVNVDLNHECDYVKVKMASAHFHRD